MTTQIAVRLPDDLVEFLDQQVSEGSAHSRADVVATAVRREQRHRRAVADAMIYAEHGEDPDMERMIAYTSAHPVEIG